MNDYVVTSLDRYTKIRSGKSDTAGCGGLLSGIENAFPNDAAIMTEVVECYGMLKLNDQAGRVLARAQAIDTKSADTEKRLKEIEGFLGRDSSGGIR